MNSSLQTTVNSINKQKWTQDVNIEDIRFKCTRKGFNRRIEVKFEGDKHYCFFQVFADRVNDLQVSKPTYFMGDQNTHEIKKKILRYLFFRFWIWIKSADAVYNSLIKNFDYSIDEALNIVADVFDRQEDSDAFDFSVLAMFYRMDRNNGIYKVSNDIELPEDYTYIRKDLNELKNTNPIITF